MTHDQIDDLRSSLKKLSYYCFDAESISLCAWYFAACGKSDIVGDQPGDLAVLQGYAHFLHVCPPVARGYIVVHVILTEMCPTGMSGAIVLYTNR